MTTPHRRRAVGAPVSVRDAVRITQRRERLDRRKDRIRTLIRDEVGPELAAAVHVVDLSDNYVEVRYGTRTLHIEDMVGAPTSWYTRRTLGLRWGRRRPKAALQSLFAGTTTGTTTGTAAPAGG